MVEAVDHHTIARRYLREFRTRKHVDRVGEEVARVPVVVVAVDVLKERSAERHVDDLLTATDAEDRHTLIHGGPHERDLGEIQGWINVRGLLLAHLPVCGWVHVPAAGNEEPIDVVNHRRRLCGRETVRLRIQRDGLAAGSLDGAQIGRVIRGSAAGTAGHPNPRFGHLEDPSRARGAMAASTRDELIGEPISPPKLQAPALRYRRTLLRSTPVPRACPERGGP